MRNGGEFGIRATRAPRHARALLACPSQCPFPEPGSLEKFQLVKFDPAGNCYRYISMEIAQDLFGIVIMRRWGRVGMVQNVESIPVPSKDAASLFINRYHLKKRRKGYEDLIGAIEGVFLLGARLQKRSLLKQLDAEKIVAVAPGAGPLFASSDPDKRHAAGGELVHLFPDREAPHAPG